MIPLSHHERVQFRFILMECCGHQLCWVNPRLPSYCPACGKSVYPQVRGWVSLLDPEAEIHYHG